MKHLNKKEKIIYAILFLVILVPFCFYAYATFFQKNDASRIIIKQDGKIIKILPLDKNTEFIVESMLGKNVVTVKDGGVSVTDADCQDKICVKTAPLKKDNAATSVIVCLPHKLIITLEK